MGWSDCCDYCGGHANENGDTLHRPGCAKLVAVEIHQDSSRQIALGVTLNLAAQEAMWLMTAQEEKRGMSPWVAENALERVMARFFAGGIDLSALEHDQIINSLLREFEHGI